VNVFIYDAAMSPPSPGTPSVTGTFELVDHFGRPVDERSYGDHHLLVFFGFTHCSVVCPRELAKLSLALELLGADADNIQPLYVSVDPARDDPETLRRYLGRYSGGFIGLTGTAERIDAAKKSFRVFAERVADAQAPGGYVVPHTALAYLMAPGGRYLAHFTAALDALTVAARIRRHLHATESPP
jgi:protein SCO1/2